MGLVKMDETAKDRVIKEQEELKDKYIKLVDFMYSGKFYNIPLNQRNLLLEQERYMKEYLSVLTERISTWDMTQEEINKRK